MTRPVPAAPPGGDVPDRESDAPDRETDAWGQPAGTGGVASVDAAGAHPGLLGDDQAEPGQATGPAGRGRRGPAVAVALAALGVVFGDIGTSPLYSLQTVFSLDNGLVRPRPSDVYGVVSMVFWSINIVVSAKYIAVLMRADNDGQGGVMALAALAQRVLGNRSARHVGVAVILAMAGTSLFFGDAVITPAISVLSSVEGLKVTAPGLTDLVAPITVVILVALFAVQRYGTGRVGAWFGPVMLAWFVVITALGVPSIAAHPDVIRGLSPTYAAGFVADHPFLAFVAMGAVVLCITGAEALYADMGHFGRAAIARAWFLVVLPALTVNYLGQAALILDRPGAAANPFFLQTPTWARLPVVILATGATVIASQAVISGAFALARQASSLGLLPPLTIRQTSDRAMGQVYLPVINTAMFTVVIILVATFRTSARLATAYGIAVTGALIVDTTLMLVVARALWGWRTWQVTAAAAGFSGLETIFLAGNLTKVIHGGWLPLAIATALFVTMTSWRRGRDLVTAKRTALEGPLDQFVDSLRGRDLPRVPGTAVFPNPSTGTTPLAMRAAVEHNGILHEQVIIVTVLRHRVPHVTPDRRLQARDLGDPGQKIVHLAVHIGFSDRPDIPAALHRANTALLPAHGITLDPGSITYFLSRASIQPTPGPGMPRWRKTLFLALAHNAADPSRYFNLPVQHTLTVGFPIDL